MSAPIQLMKSAFTMELTLATPAGSVVSRVAMRNFDYNGYFASKVSCKRFVLGWLTSVACECAPRSFAFRVEPRSFIVTIEGDVFIINIYEQLIPR